MLNQLGVLFACLCVLGGASLLYQGSIRAFLSLMRARPWSYWPARAFLPSVWRSSSPR
jgi:hypothetical protein